MEDGLIPIIVFVVVVPICSLCCICYQRRRDHLIMHSNVEEKKNQK